MKQEQKYLLILLVIAVVLYVAYRAYQTVTAPIRILSGFWAKTKEGIEGLQFWKRTHDESDETKERETYETAEYKRPLGILGTLGGAIEDIMNPISELFQKGGSPQQFKIRPIWSEEQKGKKKRDREEILTKGGETTRYVKRPVGGIPKATRVSQGLGRERTGLLGFGKSLSDRIKESYV